MSAVVEHSEGKRVYLRDGREASYVMKNGSTHLVRVILEVEGSYHEPGYTFEDDKITPVAEVYERAPICLIDTEFAQKQTKLADARDELNQIKAEVAELQRSKSAIEKAAQKYPDISAALDFIEGRITHFVANRYGALSVLTFEEAMHDNDRWGGRVTFDGIKLLCLFGTDGNGKKTAWKANRYRDGSGGSWVTLDPFLGEEAARAALSDQITEAFDAWREDRSKSRPNDVDIAGTLKANPWLEAPQDWLDHVAAIQAEAIASKLAKLRAEIAELEATQ